MVDKVEAGKRYKLVDRDAYLTRLGGCNTEVYSKYFKDDIITISYVVGGNGFINGCNGHSAISSVEYTFFELIEDTILHLQQINSPLEGLDKQTKKDLLCAWVDGAKIEFSFDGKSWLYIASPSWVDEVIYRVKPPVSEKDKLIAAAQQKLKEAQEELTKAQGL